MKKNRIAIIGCGNPFIGDDGAGILVMQYFEGRDAAGIDAIDGGSGGMGLIPLMEGYEKVVIVDAMQGIGDHIGDVRVLKVPPSWDLPICALHDIGIGEVVAIARELGYVAEIVVVGIEVGEIRAFSQEMDQAVKAAIEVARQEIEMILRDWADPVDNVS